MKDPVQSSSLSTITKTLASLYLFTSTLALADECLNYDIKRDSYSDSDARHSTYVKCKPGEGAGSYGALNSIGQQMQGFMERRSANNGYSDAEREAYRRESEAYRRSDEAYKAEQGARRGQVNYGAWVELGGADYSQYLYPNASISPGQRQAIRQEIGTAIASGKLLETYGGKDFSGTGAWGSDDPVTRWKNCEVATQLVRAYVFGDFIRPEQKNPALGLSIAVTGSKQEHCGGTAYWLGRIYEAGDSLVPGVDKKQLGKNPKWEIESAYGTAIINGFTPAYERMAELYRLEGPERFRGKTYFVLSDFASYPYWSVRKNDSDTRYLMKVQYSKCLEAEPANLVCARGLAGVYGNQGQDFLDGYTAYNPKLAAYYTDYAKELEAKLAKAWLPVPTP